MPSAEPTLARQAAPAEAVPHVRLPSGARPGGDPINCKPDDVRRFLEDYASAPHDVVSDVGLGATRAERKMAYAVVNLVRRELAGAAKAAAPKAPKTPAAPAQPAPTG